MEIYNFKIKLISTDEQQKIQNFIPRSHIRQVRLSLCAAVHYFSLRCLKTN